ncbi:MAG: response regulator [Gemmatimonadaceae bacterium]|nr:response regulator [Gemmatimonadaceae bacterium]
MESFDSPAPAAPAPRTPAARGAAGDAAGDATREAAPDAAGVQPWEAADAAGTRLASTAATIKRDWSPLWIALVYAVLGILWIVWSDAAVLAIVRDQEALTRLQTYKGWFYVTASAALLFYLVRRRVNALNAAIASQQATTRERERLVTILEATTDLVCVINPDSSLRYLNAAGRRLLGIGPTEALDRFRSSQFLAPSDAGQRPDVQLLAGSADVLELERDLLRLDGSLVQVSQVLLVHRDAGGGVEFISTIARDITEQRRQEGALRQAQKMEAVGRLAGGVAHDFNNLLTVILNCGDALARSLPASDERREEASEIVQAAQRAARLTRQLLAFSRQQVLEARTVDVNTVVRNLLVMLRRLVGDNVQILDRLDPATPPILVDPNQLEQVLVNLVVNARDAMPRGGTITIRTADAHVGEKRVAVLEVKDTGVGMDEATRARIFEPFFTTKEMGHGTGLGLATVAGIVEQSGGEIVVESAPGRGSIFRVRFPAVAADDADPDAAARAAGTPASSEAVSSDWDPRCRIVVVEDQDAVRQVTARMLMAEGYDVVQARSAEEALRTINDGQDVALIVTDVEMPGIGGGALARLLERGDRRIPVLFMSGYTNDSLLRRGALPANASFVPKPFTQEVLRSAVRSAIRPSIGG